MLVVIQYDPTTVPAYPGIFALLADVDGTLVTKQKVITRRAIEAVQRLHENGIAFFITSGRPPRGMRMLVEPLGLKMPMAAFNGGMTVHPDLTVVDERPLPDDVVPDFRINLKRIHEYESHATAS